MSSAATAAAHPRPVSLKDGWGHIYDKGILKLQRMVRGNLSGELQFTNEEFMELYSLVYNMCNQERPHTAKLYKLFRKSVEHYLTKVSVPAVRESPEDFKCAAIVKQWQDHRLISDWMCRFFCYVDRFYVRRRSLLTLGQVCLDAFRRLVFSPMEEQLRAGVLRRVARDRNSAPGVDVSADRKLIRSAARIFEVMGLARQGGSAPKGRRAGAVDGAPSDRKHGRDSADDLKLYRSGLETPLLAETAAFYVARARDRLVSTTCSEYLADAEVDIAAERERAQACFHGSTVGPAVRIVRQKLLVQTQADILELKGGPMSMLTQGRTEDLARLYKLYAPCGARTLDPIAEVLKKYVRARGQQVLAAAAESKGALSVVGALVALHRACVAIVTGPFRGSPVFHKALNDAFEDGVVNQNLSTRNGVHSAPIEQLLADNLDALLRRRGAGIAADADREGQVDTIVTIFGFLRSKDIFAEFYRLLLADRLLGGHSASMTLEAYVIGKLKFCCGAQYTAKMEGMVKDARAGETVSRGFAGYLTSLRDTKQRLPPDAELSVRVLTQGFWPTQSEEPIVLPPAVHGSLSSYEDYYRRSGAAFQNRRLRWVHSQSTVVLQTSELAGGRTYQLRMSGIQAVVLLALSKYPNGTAIAALSAETKVPPATMKRVLRTFVSQKARVILKDPRSGYRVTDTVRPNPGFSSVTRKIRLPSARDMKELKARASSKRAQKALFEKRKYAIEAAIVRVLKSCTVISHEDLFKRVTTELQVTFKPSMANVKKCIEHLIETEYMRRHKRRQGWYRYLA